MMVAHQGLAYMLQAAVWLVSQTLLIPGASQMVGLLYAAFR